jgi:hypothetical protein
MMRLVLLNAEKKGVSILLKFVELSEERNLYCTVLVVSKLRIPEGIFCSVLFCSVLSCFVFAASYHFCTVLFNSMLLCKMLCCPSNILLSIEY